MVPLQSADNVGEKQGKSLLARDAPSIWYEAASELPALLSAASQSAAASTVSEAEFEAKKQTAIAALQNEEAVFEKDLGTEARVIACALPVVLSLCLNCLNQGLPEDGAGLLWNMCFQFGN